MPLQLFGHFLIFLSKITEIHVWNKLKSYKKAPISTQIFAAMNSNEQILTGSQRKRLDYVGIDYFIGAKSIARNKLMAELTTVQTNSKS